MATEPLPSEPPARDVAGAADADEPLSDSAPESALPSVTARVAAFASVLLGGAMGGLIGWALGTLLGYGALGSGTLLLLGALSGAGGVAVVAVLTLRALVEWQQVQNRGAGR